MIFARKPEICVYKCKINIKTGYQYNPLGLKLIDKNHLQMW